MAELQAEYKAEASAEDYRKAVETYEKLVAGEPDPVEQPASMCVTIPKWVVVGYAWYVIVAGGASAAVGGLDGAIVGLPVGAVLNAVGIGATVTGSGLLYRADHTSWPKRVCLRSILDGGLLSLLCG